MAQEEKEKKVTEPENETQKEVSQESVENSETTESQEEVQEDVDAENQDEPEKEPAVASEAPKEEEKSEEKDPQPVSEKKESEEEVKEETDEQPVSVKEESADVEEDKEEVKEEVETEATEVAASTEEQEESSEDHDQHENEEGEDDHDDDDHHLDYSNYSKTQLVQAIESQYKNNDLSEVGKILKEIKPAYDEIYNAEKEEAYQKYLEEGGEKDGFEYKPDELDLRFQEAYKQLRDKRHNYINSMAKQKDENLAKKQAILEKLREIVDADETVTSLKDLKAIQEDWKNTGPVAPQHQKGLWANYNALIDRYYDQRSIYFELKELDRKKNLESKLELCVKAEELEQVENIKDAIKVLNELHEEFKHIGPVPKEDQEGLWKRFKTASDAVYARRKEYYERLKEELKINQVAKEALAEKVQPFTDFDSERISDWNAKTKEILAVQREWESIGGLPRDAAKSINKKFWSAFKQFFNNKGKFFKKIDKMRQENLAKKEELMEEAEKLKDSEDFSKTAETLKELQRKWKDIGPVPEKSRNEIYHRFKSACDEFFNRKRQKFNAQEKDYVENLKKKQAFCEELEKMAKDGETDIDRVEDIVEDWPEIGFVPRANIKSIQTRFLKAVSDAIDQTDLEEDEKQRIKFTAQFSKLKYGPNSNRILQKKENTLRRQISKLENDIVLWKNNLTFFADSKTADKVREEFNEKIDKATKELHSLEEQLRAINNI